MLVARSSAGRSRPRERQEGHDAGRLIARGCPASEALVPARLRDIILLEAS